MLMRNQRECEWGVFGIGSYSGYIHYKIIITRVNHIVIFIILARGLGDLQNVPTRKGRAARVW